MPGRRGGGSSRGGRPPPSRETTISKAMSFVLRHGAQAEGLKLDKNGFANVADLLSWQRLHSLKVTFPELRQIVTQNDKQRFTLIPLPSTTTQNPTSSPSVEPSQYLIRAAQGHSLAIASENLLMPITADDADCPEKVVHGTSIAAWKSILQSGGLKKMGRQHVHFAIGLPDTPPSKSLKPDSDPQPSPATAEPTVTNTPEEITAQSAQKVVSGMRNTANVMVWVDVKRSMQEGGLKWWKSANGVVLTEGDGESRVTLEWVTRVERRGTGEVIWERDERVGSSKRACEPR